MDAFEERKMQQLITYQCGEFYNGWIKDALECVPEEIAQEYEDKITFLGMDCRDACRMSKQIRLNREIIVLSDRIMPLKGPLTSESDLDIRYFIFCVLHEITHVVKDHKTELFDGIQKEEHETQEKRRMK